MASLRPVVACAAAVALGAAGASAAGGPEPASAAARKSCRTGGAIVVKRRAAGVVLSRVRSDGAVAYSACSTRYGRRVALATDASELVDEVFTLRRTAVSSTAATLVYCVQYDIGADLHTVKANLRTGRTTRTSEATSSTGCR
jgi:hypothetical protein